MKILGVKNSVSKIFTLNLLVFFCIGEDLTALTTQESEAEATLQSNVYKILTLFHTMNASLEKFHGELIGKIALIEAKIESTSEKVEFLMATQKTAMGSTRCGGLVEVRTGVVSAIRYPSPGDYSNDHRCAWSIAHREKTVFASYRIKINSFSTEKNLDGLNIYYYDFTGELKSQKIRTFGKWISIDSPNVVITFFSDGSGVGEGFYATIFGVGAVTNGPTIKRLGSITKSFSYLPSSDNYTDVMVEGVVQPGHEQHLKVDLSADIQRGDSLRLYELTCQHNATTNFQLIARRSEDGSWTYNNPQSSSCPILVIFRGKSSSSWFKLDIQNYD